MNPVFYHPEDGPIFEDVSWDPAPWEANGWYFWDETWVNYYGPYSSEEEANKKCQEYAEQL